MLRRRAVYVLVAVVIAELALRGASWLAFDLMDYRPSSTHNEVLNRLAFAYHWSPGGRETSPLFRPDPRRGYRLAAGARDDSDPAAVATTSSVGSRGAGVVAPEPRPGTLRVACVGDSFTFGVGVGDGETWPRALQAALPGSETVNFGGPGYGHDQALLALEDDGLPLGPQVAVFGYFDGGVERNALDFFAYAKPKFDVESGDFGNLPIPPPDDVRRRTLWMPRLVLAVEALVAGTSTRRDAEEIERSLLARMLASCEAAGTKLVFAAIVGSAEIERSRAGTHGLDWTLAEFCRTREVLCLDPIADFVARCRHDGNPGGPACFQETSPHYTAFGNRVFGETVAAYLISKQLYPATGPGESTQPDQGPTGAGGRAPLPR